MIMLQVAIHKAAEQEDEWREKEEALQRARFYSFMHALGHVMTMLPSWRIEKETKFFHKIARNFF